MANELIQSTAQDRTYPLVAAFDWYILPNVNPDGYEYSHTTERMWLVKAKPKSKGVQSSYLVFHFLINVMGVFK